jgi:hypothetical protein
MAEPATVQAALNRFLCPERLSPQQAKVCRHLQACRTEAMGCLRWACTECGHTQEVFHGCRDRHCPQCQAHTTRVWAERQQKDLLPLRYYHVVFTLPHALNGWIQLHPEVLYNRLFASTWDTLRTFGEDPRRLHGQLGVTAVLHTWGQNLSQHVHLHCLIPGGALQSDGQWTMSRGHSLFPVRALSHCFRGKMVARLREAAKRGELFRVTRPGEINQVLDQLMTTEWVVYAKDCIDYTDPVVHYLARYTHRSAITNSRILALDDDSVTLRYKDYGDHGKEKHLRLDGAEFVRRYLLHVLPKGFMRIRHFGFLANRCRLAKLAQIRHALHQPPARKESEDPQPSVAVFPCPQCRTGQLRMLRPVSPMLPNHVLPEHRRS